MKRYILPILIFIPILCATVQGQDPESDFTSKFNEGFEPAVLLADHGSDDGAVSLIFSARKAGLGAAEWPAIIEDVSVNATGVDVDNCTAENWIVSLDEKKRLGVVKSADPDFRAYYPGQNHYDLAAIWGPDQEGWRYGVLNYTGRWACSEIFFVNHDGVEATVTSMRALLDRATTAEIVRQSKDAGSHAISYELLEFVNPDASSTVADPLSIRIRYIAQIPKDDESDVIEGTHLVEISRDQKGVASATLLSAAGADTTPATPDNVPSEEAFAALRQQSGEAVDAGVWKAVKKDFKPDGEGHTKFVTGWLEANVIQQLTRVDSRGEGNEEIVIYYWREGLLVSISKFTTGTYTKQEGIKQRSDTFNFHEGRLVSWTSSIGGVQDPSQEGFQDLGTALLGEAQYWSDPIYEAIGAD